MKDRLQTWNQYLIKKDMGLWKEIYGKTGEFPVIRFHWKFWAPLETEHGDLVRFGRYMELVPPAKFRFEKDLRRCPFCDGEALNESPMDFDDNRCTIMCEDCYVGIERESESEAVVAWNRRV